MNECLAHGSGNTVKCTTQRQHAETLDLVNVGALLLCVRSPQHEDKALRLIVEVPDDGVSDFLPAAVFVSVSAGCLDGQH